MYEINLVQRAIVSSEKSQKAVKVFKVFSLLLTFAIIGLLGYTAYTILERDKVIDQINELKIKIDEKRRLNKVKEVEAEWTRNYNKLLAIKDMTANNTKTGLMFREVGLYMPTGDFLCAFSFTPGKIVHEAIKAKALSDVKYDVRTYSDTIKEAYERSSYLGSDPIVVDDKRETLEVKGRKVEVLNVTMPYVTEKK
jgi:hypothetical protein